MKVQTSIVVRKLPVGRGSIRRLGSLR